jgi:hypothetical protein
MKVEELKSPKWFRQVRDGVDELIGMRQSDTDVDQAFEDLVSFFDEQRLFDKDAKNQVGHGLRTEKEAFALNVFAKKLGSLLEGLDWNAPFDHVVAHPGWSDVIESAQKVSQLMHRDEHE